MPPMVRARTDRHRGWTSQHGATIAATTAGRQPRHPTSPTRVGLLREYHLGRPRRDRTPSSPAWQASMYAAGTITCAPSAPPQDLLARPAALLDADGRGRGEREDAAVQQPRAGLDQHAVGPGEVHLGQAVLP